jgi:hypothetical protein
MKRFVLFLAVPVLLMALAAPVQAEAALPYTTNLVTDGRGGGDVGDLTVGTDGTVTFQIDEGTGWRLSGTTLIVSDTPQARGWRGVQRYQHNRLNGTTSDVYNIDLIGADANGDGVIYISAQADLVRQPDSSPRFRRPMPSMRDTAWAEGDGSTTRRGGDQGRFFTIFVNQPAAQPGGPIG